MRYVYIGLLGVDFLMLLQLLSIKPLDISLRFSLYCFAIAIPQLAIIGIFIIKEARPHYSIAPKVRLFCSYAGLIPSLLGILCIFWHFSQFIALLFIISSIFAYIFWAYLDQETTANFEEEIPLEEESKK